MEDVKEIKPPVKVDDEIEVEIESRGSRGDGVAKCNNFILFIPNTEVGDKITVKVEKVFHKFGIARRMLLEENESDVEDNNENGDEEDGG